jgi:hypothetical protein
VKNSIVIIFAVGAYSALKLLVTMPTLLKAAVGALLLSANGGAFGRSLLKDDATSVTELFTTKPQVRSDTCCDHCSFVVRANGSSGSRVHGRLQFKTTLNRSNAGETRDL